MAILVIGSGYVGLPTSLVFSKLGERVSVYDTNTDKLEQIRNKESIIYEEGLAELIRNTDVRVTCNIEEGLKDYNICFICVGTPTRRLDMSADLSNVIALSDEIAKTMDHYILIVIKSTVPPGTTEDVIIPIFEKYNRRLGRDYGICFNPEFLREGVAIHDFMYPDRIIIGESDESSGLLLYNLYKKYFTCPILRTSLKAAEMIKYASNSFLALKISYMNEIGNICKKLGVDSYEVARGMGYDCRIGEKFLNAGAGFGGSCLKKDLKALIACSKGVDYQPKILEQILEFNEEQPFRLIKLLKQHIPDLSNKEIGILGLAFKPNTDDIRDAISVKIVDCLIKEGVQIKAYDPKAMENFKEYYPDIKYCSPEEVLKCQAVLILTEWPEFNELNYRGTIVIDGRRVLKATEALIYEGICW